jgi:hypothetical protein
MATETSEAVRAMILERRQARTSAYTARTTARAQAREWFARRRTAGLEARHTAKLARSRQSGTLA